MASSWRPPEEPAPAPPGDRTATPGRRLHRRMATRDRALRRLRNTTRLMTVGAAAGAGILALGAARSVPGRHVVAATSTPPSSAGSSTASTSTSVSVTAPSSSAPTSPSPTSPSVTARSVTPTTRRSATPATRAVPATSQAPVTALQPPATVPVPTTSRPVVTSGAT